MFILFLMWELNKDALINVYAIVVLFSFSLKMHKQIFVHL